jgi:hypothetical protein
MNDLQRFERYAAAFEEAVVDDSWSAVAEHFAADAVYEIIGEPPLGGRHEGREAVLAHFEGSLNSFDRAFDSRSLDVLEGPEIRDGAVWLSWRASYGIAGAPDLALEGEETVTFEGDRIVRLEDRYPEGAGARMMKYLGEHGAKLHPAGGSGA